MKNKDRRKEIVYIMHEKIKKFYGKKDNKLYYDEIKKIRITIWQGIKNKKGRLNIEKKKEN